jgi:hypothetical protein
MGQVFLPSLRFLPVSIIPSVLPTRLHLLAALTAGQTGDAWEPSKVIVVSGIAEHWT